MAKAETPQPHTMHGYLLTDGKLNIEDTKTYSQVLPKFPTEAESAALTDQIAATDSRANPKLKVVVYSSGT